MRKQVLGPCSILRVQTWDSEVPAPSSVEDLIGVPWQVAVGPRSLAEGKVEVKKRSGGEKELMSVAAAIDRLSK